jgi:hypothetical protein
MIPEARDAELHAGIPGTFEVGLLLSAQAGV